MTFYFFFRNTLRVIGMMQLYLSIPKYLPLLYRKYSFDGGDSYLNISH
jgi:hypothetical protein